MRYAERHLRDFFREASSSLEKIEQEQYSHEIHRGKPVIIACQLFYIEDAVSILRVADKRISHHVENVDDFHGQANNDELEQASEESRLQYVDGWSLSTVSG